MSVRKQVVTHSGERVFLPGQNQGLSLTIPAEYADFYVFLEKSFKKFRAIVQDFFDKTPPIEADLPGHISNKFFRLEI